MIGIMYFLVDNHVQQVLVYIASITLLCALCHYGKL